MALNAIQPTDNLFFKRANWKHKKSILPRRCVLTGERIKMFTDAFCGTATYTGPGDAIQESKWISKNTYLILKLKGDI